MDFTQGRQNFFREINQPDEQINLARAALYYAQLEYPELDPEVYLNSLQKIAEEVDQRLPETRYPLKTIQIINQHLFEELGFTGNSRDYYDPRNSFLNQVMERRTGIPITLSVVYLEIARRVNFPMVGIAMPGHFLIRPVFEDVGIFVDTFNQGELMFPADCEARLIQVYQQEVKLQPQFLEPVSKRQILARMLTNLKFIYINNQQLSKALGIVDLVLMLDPHNPQEMRDRGLLHYELGEWKLASQDLEVYLKILPNAPDAAMVRHLLQKLQ